MVQKRKRNVKINLVFDEEKRRDFLTGFHKRKLHRKKVAKEKLEKDLKEEKKRLKLAARLSHEKHIKSSAPIPEIENLLRDEYEDDNVNIKIVGLSANEIADNNNWIGVNHPNYNESDGELEEAPESEVHIQDLGMEFGTKPSLEKHQSKRDMKKILKKEATRNVQKSKVFQAKYKLELQKQKKKALRQKRLRIKLQNKSLKKKGKKFSVVR